MKNIQIICDRCGLIVEGLIAMEGMEEQQTAGFYDVTRGNWQQFQRWEEERVCDKCMHSDPKYRQMYIENK
jgi:hypothetical protein